MSTLAKLLTSTSSEVGKLAQRCKARLKISQYHDEFYKLLVSGNLDDADLTKIALESLLAAMYLAAFGGKVIVVTHKGNSLFEAVEPDSKGELTCINRSVPLTQLPSQLHSEYPNGFAICLPAIRYIDGSLKYLKGNGNLEGIHELLLVALDEGQTDLPNEPTLVRVGRYELVEDLSNLDVIDRIEGGRLSQSISSLKVEFELLPTWKMDEMIIEESIVQLEDQPPISRANLAKHIRNRIALATQIIGNSNGLSDFQAHALNNIRIQLELYLEIVEAETEEFTIDYLRNLVEDYGTITRISDAYLSFTLKEMDISAL